MIIIELEGKEYKMPQSWSEVNLGKWEKVMNLLSLFGEYKSQNQYAMDLIQVLTEAPIEDLRKMTRKSFDELSTMIEFIKEEIKPNVIREWNIDGEEYVALEDLNSLNMGDSVSLELVIGDSTEYNLSINVLPILIRKSISKVKNGETIKVPGEFDAEKYNELKELFKEKLYVTDVLWLKDFF